MNSCVRAVALLGLLAGCASPPEPPPPLQNAVRDRVVLLPQSDGTTGSIVVRRGSQATVLDKPYATARSAGADKLETGQADSEATRKEFAAVLQALPPAPVSFIVYFITGQDELTEESRRAFDPVLQDFARRPAAEITVIGHTDQTGSDKINDPLSHKRAERVRDMLVQRGVPSERIGTAGRGSRELLDRGAGPAADARNRRVEIHIR
jgi:outer membrane protein OmpA-like peptidoglycan-associated protein